MGGGGGGMGGLTEDSAPLVGNLITSDCIVKLYLSNPPPFMRGLDCWACPTIGAIDVLSSRIPQRFDVNDSRRS